MRASLVVICLLLTVALLVQDASARRLLWRRPRKSIWSHIRGNAADIKKLINENQQFEQEIGPVIDTLKENVDDMKEGFAAQTMLMAQMKTSMIDMKDAIANLQKITSEGEIYNTYVVTKLFSIFKSKYSVDWTGSEDGSGLSAGK